MCGICGVVTPRSSGRVIDEARMIAMRDSLAHRGPDDAGLWSDEGVWLGHRRLSIVDIAGGHQPMTSASGRHTITYNGEVYNHAELRPALSEMGAQFQTRCDTETVLAEVAAGGVEGITRLRGMFAFAVWDRAERNLMLARDRLGIKPLYYLHEDDGTLWFASEIKALVAAGALRPSLNFDALPDYLANHAPSGAETLFAGVRRLTPGHVLTWDEGRIVETQYWNLLDAPPLAGGSDDELVAAYDHRFEDAVRARLMSDVPLGVFLSGGIDSAAITATMARLVDDPIKTFSVAFAEREANELAFARRVAEQYRTDHHEVLVRPEAFWRELPSLVWHEDEPIAHPSSIPLHFVSRLASDHVKVVLTGEGSDETLAGYNRYRVTMYNMRMGAWYARLTPRSLRQVLARWIRARPRETAWQRRLVRTFVALPYDLDHLYFDNFAVFSRDRQAQLLAESTRSSAAGHDPYTAFHHALEASSSRSLLDQLLYADTNTYLQELLMKQDQMSMAASLESRVPFLDHHLVEFATRLPDRLRLRGTTTKVILRRIMQDRLPAEILSRRKMGFPVPVGRWLRERYTSVLDEYVTGPRPIARGLFNPAYIKRVVAEHIHGYRRHDERLWSLINLELWHRVFVDGESPAAIEPLTGDTRAA